MILLDKVAVITGASDGIGKEIALKLAEKGVNLILLARNEKRLFEVCEKAKTLGSKKCKYYVCDLTSKKAIKQTVESIKNDFSAVDILINNAGIWHTPKDISEFDVDEIETIISANLTGHIQLTSLIASILKKQKEAAIVNISSRSGYTAYAGQSVYGASKWGMTGFTEILKIDYKGTNIRVASVHQGGTNTKIFEKAGDTRDSSNYIDPKDLADVIIFILTRPKKLWIHDIRVEY